jgi:hypothetical protein
MFGGLAGIARQIISLGPYHADQRGLRQRTPKMGIVKLVRTGLFFTRQHAEMSMRRLRLVDIASLRRHLDSTSLFAYHRYIDSDKETLDEFNRLLAAVEEDAGIPYL